MIEWKFDQLDKNKDEILKRRETRTIKRMVRKLIQPKACARMFLEYCDSDGDRMIKKKEWTYCLNTNASSSEYQYLFSFTKKKISTMLTMIILSVSRGFVCTFLNEGLFSSKLSVHKCCQTHIHSNFRHTLKKIS